jgi:hypothetical protein|tara:strand:- start:298 stop:570 length:273 start_codon:yes stop_codon:yes gene_type:complete
MQKLINVLAVLSFVGVAGIYGGGYYVYSQKDAIVDNIKTQIMEAAVGGVAGALPGLMGGTPELPGVELPGAKPGAIGTPSPLPLPSASPF